MDKRRRILLSSLLLSLLLHILFLWFINFRDLLLGSATPLAKSQPEEVIITFPENKPEPEEPWEIVQNQNESEETPDNTNLLSDKNSRAKNPELSENAGSAPMSEGNVPLPNLSNTPQLKSFRDLQKKKFSTAALTGDTYKAPKTEMKKNEETGEAAQLSDGSNQTMNQKKFSVEELGALTLSTYRWAWAPYVNAMKNKLYRVWFPPTAYYRLGLIHGYTVIRYTINRDGTLLKFELLKHDGHKSLELSSSQAIKALFPFLALPDDFPDETLTITAKLIYPDLRRGR